MSKSTLTTVIVAIILFISSLTAFGFVFFQVNSQGQQLGEQIATLQAERAQEDSYFRLQKISEDTIEDREEIARYFLANESSSIDFLNLVESLAPKAGVSLSTESLDIVNDATNNTKWVEVSFAYSASRERVDNFLKILETLPYVLRIQDYSMSRATAGEWQAQVTMRVQVLNYD